jgi:hypothetical protein
MQEEKFALSKLLEEKDRNFQSIQSQLHSLKRRIHHHKSAWVQIAEDNKLLKNQLLIISPESSNEKDFLKFHLEFLLKKIYTGVSSSTQKNYVLSLLNNDKYFACLQEVVLGTIGFFEEDSEKSFTYSHSGKNLSAHSIEKAISPIVNKNYSEDDEEIDKFLDESKVLLRTLDKQCEKLRFSRKE